jgi:hypothetical protein
MGKVKGARRVARRSEPAEEVEMSPLTVACFFIAAPVAGLGLLELQARLERWDQRRHADD